jgi:hypothetical protein
MGGQIEGKTNICFSKLQAIILLSQIQAIPQINVILKKIIISLRAGLIIRPGP